jgi:hypothetical protein
MHFGSRINNLEWRMIGVAGAVAELCWWGVPVDENFWFDLMSQTDWEVTHCEPVKPDNMCIEAIRSVAEVLKRGSSHWPDLLIEARKLILDSARFEAMILNSPSTVGGPRSKDRGAFCEAAYGDQVHRAAGGQ